jgi:hypothetical protein
MATTTNYGWETPDDTDLVKDGASAIRTLGSAIDTTTKNLNPETTLGDISYRSATANTNTRLGIGSSGQVLTVSGGVPAWTTISAGGHTLLASGSLPAANTLTLSAISQDYEDLVLFLRNPYLTVDDDIKIQFNTTANSNYPQITFTASNSTFASSAANGIAFIEIMGISNSIDNISNQANNAYLRIFDYANTLSGKSFITLSQYKTQSLSDKIFEQIQGSYSLATAISSIKIYTGAGDFAGGTYELWGIK